MLSYAATEASRDQSVAATLSTLRSQIERDGSKPGEVGGLANLERAMRPNLDSQIVTLMFRGAQVAKARDLYVAARADLSEGYRAYVKARSGPRRALERFVGNQAFLFSLYGIYVSSHRLVHEGLAGLANPTGLLTVATLGAASLSAVLMSWVFARKVATFEVFPEVLQEQLTKAIQGKLPAPYFTQAWLETDARVISEMLTAKLSPEARNEAYRRSSNTLVGGTLDFVRSLGSPDQFVKYATEQRTVEMQQAIFFDRDRNEPVWIYVVRSDRRRIGSPPRSRGRSTAQVPDGLSWAQ